MAALSVSAGAQQHFANKPSPFRESEWDRKLDYLLEDLERSGDSGDAAAVGRGPARQQTQQAAYSSSSQHQSSTGLQQSKSYSASSSSHLRSQSASSSLRAQQQQQQQLEPFPSLSKSKSGHSLHESADNMLKDLEGSLKASSNYIESHRTVSGPQGTREYHEYRSFSNDGDVAGRNAADDFNLERQVQHMMPSSNGHYASSGLQSANMVSSMQQQKQSYSTYKVQSNQYSSNGERILQQQDDLQPERPGSRLKQNIDELDTLLYDLNNARKMSDAGADYTASSITPGNVSSDDYSFSEGHQGHVKKTAQSYSGSSYHATGGGDYSSRKPPSPSPRRRPQQQPTQLASPSNVRRLSPGPPARKAEMSSSYSYSSSYTREGGSQLSPYKVFPTTTTTTDYMPPAVLPPISDGTPTGASYYAKYHSTHSHQSQQQRAPTGPPASFPSSPAPRVSAPLKTQTPPKRVDELLSELSEFDSSIKTTGFVEPIETPRRPAYREPSPEPYVAAKPAPAPVVYYPTAGEASRPTTAHATSLGAPRKGKDKGKDKEAEGKQGAAVVPICLPLCCAAPCVIM